MRKKIRILYVVTNCELGGAQKTALFSLQSLDLEQYEKFYLCSRQGELAEECRKIPGISFCFTPLLRRRINLVLDLLALVFISGYIRKHKIEIVHTHCSKAGIVGRWAGFLGGARAIVHTAHGWSFHDYQQAGLKNFYVQLERLTAMITDKIITVSLGDKQKGISHKIAPEEKIQTIYYGVEAVPEQRSKAGESVLKQMFGDSFCGPCVGMIACLKPQKCPQDFVRVAEKVIARVPAAGFFLAGDGVLRGPVQEMIDFRGLQKKIILGGWRKDVYAIMPFFDAVILTSYWEGLPIALLEAMSCAKPIVAYAVDGTKEIISSGNSGFLVSPGEVEEMSEKIIFLLKDREKALEVGKKAKIVFNEARFRPETMIQKLDVLYQKLLLKNPAGLKWEANR